MVLSPIGKSEVQSFLKYILKIYKNVTCRVIACEFAFLCSLYYCPCTWLLPFLCKSSFFM